MTCKAHALAAEKMLLEQADVDLILAVCERMPKDRRVLVADVGAGVGTTALAAFCGLDNCTVLSVDTDGASIEHARRIAVEVGRIADWSGLQTDAVGAATMQPDDSVDLLLLDTLHYYESTRADLEAWLPKMRTDGMIWVHDYVGEHDGVRRAVNALVSEGRMRETERGGLGWVGCALAEEMLWWVSWEQAGFDPRPVKWPPPECVLAFWETGEGDDCVSVVALAKGASLARVQQTITDAWNPGVGEWRFANPYGRVVPPGDRFPPPEWSIEMGRWPWKPLLAPNHKA